MDFPQVKDWIEIMGTETAENYRIDDDRPKNVIDREAHNARLHWLFTSVAPAMARVLDYAELGTTEHTPERIISMFLDYVDYNRNNS